MTGMDTAAMISRIFFGEAMRATPPSARICDGTRSSAMTEVDLPKLIGLPPDLHQNKTVELYVTAADPSGHVGQLGSADHPLKMKRKSWIDKILGKNEKGGGP